MRNFIKTIINGVQNWTKKEIKNSTADWNQNDANAADYVKNRTHYINNDVILPETVLDNLTTIKFNEILLENETYTVIADGNVYTCKTYKSDIFYRAPLVLGNEKIIADIMGHPGAIDTGEPFVFMLHNPTGDKHKYDICLKTDKIAISVIGPYIKRINDIYLPSNIFTTNNGFNIGYNTIASGDCSHAEGSNTTASNSYSHAEGCDTIASGDCSHAEGHETIASDSCSHAEGSYTIASGFCSHAEGSNTTASGDYSHAEGYETTASGDHSHAEGYETTASGVYSHAEGMWNNPEKLNSVYGFDVSTVNTSPTLDTVTISKNFTFDESTGKFTLCSPTLQVNKDNLLLYINYAMIHGENCETADKVYVIKGKSTNASYLYATVCYTASESSTKKGYIHSVGNGLSNQFLSNAHTIDYFGVGWFQGGLQVGGEAQDNGARNVLLEGDAIPVPKNAVAGDLLTYDGTSWVKISRTDLITEIIAALPRAEEATF